ncbi:MAG: Holliday junction branch migration protein RuvA [Chlorobi bacterium]|jgi:Holliday junction DNA helicase RuvA|nr:Holliday junction branch migration protein RuvA [Chlorobiota bacterium]
MIEYLSGTLLEKTPTKAVILAGGVGYGALISLATFERLPAVGQNASLHTYLAVREDAMTLYGFAETMEREMFLLLTGVNGIGPKIAIGILSSAGTDTLRENIARGNAAALTALPGVGKKTAERMALELRDKISALGGESGNAFGAAAGSVPEIRAEALAALVALGYGRPVAERAIRSALKEGPQVERNVETLLKAALKQIAG